MKVLFVRPNMSPHRSSDALEPLVFGILSALTPPEIDRSLCDERLEDIPFDKPADLVAITVETFTARRAYQIASRFLQRGHQQLSVYPGRLRSRPEPWNGRAHGQRPVRS